MGYRNLQLDCEAAILEKKRGGRGEAHACWIWEGELDLRCVYMMKGREACRDVAQMKQLNSIADGLSHLSACTIRIVQAKTVKP